MERTSSFNGYFQSLLVVLKWANETKSIEKRFVKEALAEQFLSEAIQKTNYRVGEIFLELVI